MQTTYRLHVNELDTRFLESLKALFKDKVIEIVITEADETAYLLWSEANRERLLQTVENVDGGKHLVEGDLDHSQ